MVQNDYGGVSAPLPVSEREVLMRLVSQQIERKLASTARPAGQQAAITHTISAQHQTFMNLASHVAMLHTEIEKLKAAYTGLWRARMGAAFDPFQDAH